jgi:hypothetical protein
MLMDFTPKPLPDLKKMVEEIESTFGKDNCKHCGKEFYRTHFTLCAKCLTNLDRRNKCLPEITED